MKGIVLAGGTGSRLWPITRVVCKQLLPVYDKPMVYYPISTLMLANVRDILIITTQKDLEGFRELLGNGQDFGIRISYKVQKEPKGLAEALYIGEDFLGGDSCLLILGDNIFHGSGLGEQLVSVLPEAGAHIFTYEVSNPSRYGVLELDNLGNPLAVEEKPKRSNSNLAITGLYFFDGSSVDIAKNLKPSKRGELEITDVIEHYLVNNKLTFTKLSRGIAWLDTGTPASLSDAAEYIRIIEERTGLKIGCLEEIAFRKKWIDLKKIEEIATRHSSEYYKYLSKISH